MADKRVPGDLDRVETERSDFTSLLAQNPNYFGNFPGVDIAPVKKILANTTYEQLTCVGFSPSLDTLEATIAIKLPVGYGGDLCQAGSTEWVRFYLDYGSGWQDAGLVGVNVHNIPNDNDCASAPEKPLTYVVTRKIDPARKPCKKPVLPNVRAILSWQLVPPANTPAWPPVWGSVLDHHVQITPSLFSLADVVIDIGEKLGKVIDVPVELEEVKFKPIPQPDPAPFTLAQLAKLYAAPPAPKAGKAAKAAKDVPVATAVEPHRFGIADVVQAMSAGADQPMLASAAKVWSNAGLNLAEAVAAFLKTSGNTSYEQLDCLGLDYNLERLVATFHIKKPTGYSGPPCSKGSYEYVAFYADWNDTCEWTYVGTVKTNVHDYAAIPADGLHYSAVIGADLSALREPCQKPKVARIRAILSWQTPPPPGNPNYVPAYGNRVDTHVQIRPGMPGSTGDPTSWIEDIGGIPLEQIDTTTTGRTLPFAQFWQNDHYADPWVHARQCAFGGLVIIEGPFFSAANNAYRVEVRRNGGAPQYVTQDFYVEKWGPGSTHQEPIVGGNGFFRYLNQSLHKEYTLAHWVTNGLTDGEWELRLVLGDSAAVPNPIGATQWYKIRLDNTAPEADIRIDGGDCIDVTTGQPVTGRFVARDESIGAFALSTHPDSVAIPSNPPTTTTASTVQTAPKVAGTPWTGGDAWSLDTANPKKMIACGYVVRVDVYDNTIVGSQSGSHNHSAAETGLCLRDG